MIVLALEDAISQIYLPQESYIRSQRSKVPGQT